MSSFDDVLNILSESKKGKHQDVIDTIDSAGYKLAYFIYKKVKSNRPFHVVETGTCNGVFTLSVIMAFHHGDIKGKITSIDLPYRVTDNLDEFREKTTNNFKGACIPSNKDSGWIIPDDLSSYLFQYIGKTQVYLPYVITRSEPKMLIFDSEHSLNCQMLELELAIHNTNNALVIMDDIGWTDAFSYVTDKYNVRYERGFIDNVGYIIT